MAPERVGEGALWVVMGRGSLITVVREVFAMMVRELIFFVIGRNQSSFTTIIVSIWTVMRNMYIRNNQIMLLRLFL